MRAARPAAWCATLVLSTACGPGATDFATGEADLAPAGSDATAVSNNIPLTMNPGERLNVRATMRNTGAASPANNWNGFYYLRRFPNAANPFGFVSDQVTGTIPAQPNTNEDFDFIITAPTTPGTYSFDASMYSNVSGQTGYFGALLSAPNLVVDPATTRRWDCTFEPALSTLPTTIFATEARTVTVTVRNTGTATWPAANPTSYLRSRDDLGSGDYYLWGSASVLLPLPVPVAPGNTISFTFDIVAPPAAGDYQFLRQMFQTGQPSPTGGIGFFDLDDHCVDALIAVQPSPNFRDSVLVSEDFPTVFAPSEPRLVRVTMQNTGVETWNPTDYALTSNASPASLWGATITRGDGPVTTGANEDFLIVVRGPAAPGSYAHQWRMYKYVSPGIGYFGEQIAIPATVDAGQPPFYTAAFVSQTIPTRVTAGSTVTFSITMQNTGSGPWDHEFFQIRSRNTPFDLWTTLSASLLPAEVVPVGGNRAFTFDVIAPATPGLYDSRWGMALTQGPGYFFLNSDEAVQTNIEVTLCGNSVIDPGESCDDGNLIDGDTCSSLCGGIVIDLATDATGRTLIGSTDLKQLANVAIGDMTGDGANDVAAGEMAHVYPVGLPGRSRAGIVHGFVSAGFLDGTRTTVPTGAAFQIWGANDNDRLGASDLGGIEIGDVTGDGVSDLVVSSYYGDGVGETRVDAGEVYVIQGGAALGAAGVVDLGAVTPSPLLIAQIIGPNAGSGLVVNALGDFTGDGVLDLVLGSPGDDSAGTDAGAIRIVPGGAGLTGTIDLSVGGAVATVFGANAGDRIGRVSATGDVGGTGATDLLVGSTSHTRGAINNGGGVWVLFSPLPGTSQLGLGDFDVAFLGGLNERYGASMSAANVTGAAANEVLVGASQTRNGGGIQTGSVDVWVGPFVSGTVFDLSVGLLPSTRITAPDFGDNTGRALRTGDMDNDGYAEIPVVMSAADGPANGRVNCGELGVVRGRAALPAAIDFGSNPPELRIYGAADRDYLGNQPRFLDIADIDGDGRADLCIGSQNGGTDATTNAPGRIDCFSSPF